jgi:hypothetical protein
MHQFCPKSDVRSSLIGTLVALCVVFSGFSGLRVSAAEPRATVVEVENHSVLTKCAEEDNVYYALKAAPGARTPVASFRIEAIGVPYLPVLNDSTAPDFTYCSFGQDYAADPHPYQPPTAVLYEDDNYILKGVVYPDFWRPTVVPVSVGKLKVNFLHLVQLWKKTAFGPEEFLVFYPQDGYWRLKTLPPVEMREVAYGSSFLVGPVETSTRPFVAYTSVSFDPKALAFTIAFAKGGTATVTLKDIRTNHAAIDVAFNQVADAGQGFAALRSMYVTPPRSDAAETRWQATPGAPEQTSDIVAFKSATAAAVTFGRTVPSRHNTSAPDIRFSGFTAPE